MSARRVEDLRIARAALAFGYYDEPRRLTQRDLGIALGVSHPTVALALRRVARLALQGYLREQVGLEEARTIALLEGFVEESEGVTV